MGTQSSFSWAPTWWVSSAVQNHLVKSEGVTKTSRRVLGSPGSLPQALPVWSPQDRGGREEEDPEE